MSERYSGSGAGTGGSKGYFSTGKGPGRGMEHADKPSEKKTDRGVGGGNPMPIDLEDLNKPSKGPVNFDKTTGRRMPSVCESAADDQSPSGNIG